MRNEIDQFEDLATYGRWANLRVMSSLRNVEPPASQALEIFAHLLGTERVWWGRLTDQPPQVLVWPDLTPSECAHLIDRNTDDLRTFLRSLRVGELERVVPYVNSAGISYRSKVADILLQLILHGSYHRGQIALLLRQHAVEPATTDYIEHVRGAPAASRSD